MTTGAANTVHGELRPDFSEGAHEETIELRAQNVPVAKQVVFEVGHRDAKVGESRLDLLVGDCLVVELKTDETLLPLHAGQRRSCLKAAKVPLGLLINFNVPVLGDGIKRVILSKPLGDLAVLAVKKNVRTEEYLP